MKIHKYILPIFLTVLFVIIACSRLKKVDEKTKSSYKNDIAKQTIPLTIGTYTRESSEGIYQADFNTSTGELSNLRAIANVEQPSFLTLSKDSERIYAVSEIDEGKLSVFARQKDGSYALDQEISTEGATTCHVILNEEETLVSVVNYRQGSLIVYGHERGKLSKVALYKHEGSSVHRRQQVPHPHSSYFSKNEKYIYVPDLGTDEIVTYPIIDGKPTAGKLGLKMEPGDGPSHMASNSSKDLWFVVGELTSVVWSLKSNVDGTFEVVDKQNILPDGIEGRSSAADVHVSPDGKHLYTSCRGFKNGFHGIAVFHILDSGKLESLGYVTEGINQPRNFSISLDGKFLLVANQFGNDIIVFKVQDNGMLENTGHSIEVSMPACLKF